MVKRIKKWLEKNTSKAHDAMVSKVEVEDDLDTKSFTPREFISGFIAIPSGANAIEAVWHSASIALETERIRIVHCLADNGIYFLAADASTFVNNPNSKTLLSSALPDSRGYKGEGAYLTELGGGVVAVVVKGDRLLTSYIGERKDAMKFAESKPQFWPVTGTRWEGYHEFENRQSLRVAKTAITMSAFTATLLFLSSFFMLLVATRIENSGTETVDRIKQEQSNIAVALNKPSPELLPNYYTLTKNITSQGGRLQEYRAEGTSILFRARFPSYATDFKALGDVKIKEEDNMIIVTKE